MYGFKTRDEARQAMRNVKAGHCNRDEPADATYKVMPHSWYEGNKPASWGVARYTPYQRTSGNNEPRFNGFVWFA